MDMSFVEDIYLQQLHSQFTHTLIQNTQEQVMFCMSPQNIPPSFSSDSLCYMLFHHKEQVSESNEIVLWDHMCLYHS